jgi:predicted regulator of Ras-like GTPase activity (Roadblock/LC7/MglB family)
VSEDLNTLLSEVRADIGEDFVSTQIIGQDGMAIAGESAGGNFNAQLAAAHFAMIMKLGERASGSLQLGKALETQLCTDELICLVRSLGDGRFYWLLAAKASSALGLMQAEMDQYELRLWGALS